MAISKEQFGALADQVNVPEGGFSASFATGEAPKSGYMVSYAGTEETHKPPVTPEDLQNYTKVVPITQQRGTYFGGWHKGHEDEMGPPAIFLDRSKNYPSGVMGRAEATLAMARERQQSMYHVDTGEVENNPFYGQEYPREVHASIKRQYEQAKAR